MIKKLLLASALIISAGACIALNNNLTNGTPLETKAASMKTVWVEIGNNCDWTSGKIAIGFWGGGDHWSNLVSINATDKFYQLVW